MKYFELIENAVALVCEDPASDTTDDYYERAAYILGTFVSQSAEYDNRYRITKGEDTVTHAITLFVDSERDFALSDVFIPIAVHYLAAMLVLEENEEMSEKFFSLYTDGLSSLLASLSTVEPITDRYSLLTQ